MTSSLAWDEFPALVQEVIENCDCPICVHWKWWSSIVILMYRTASKRGPIVDKLRHFSANQLICEGKGSKESGCPEKYTLYRGFNLANLVDKYPWGNGYISNLRKRNILDSKVPACRVFFVSSQEGGWNHLIFYLHKWTGPPFFFWNHGGNLVKNGLWVPWNEWRIHHQRLGYSWVVSLHESAVLDESEIHSTEVD